jgi:hypothetical protein
MVDKIDNQAVCGHLKATLHEVVPNDDLQVWIGKLNSLDPSTFVLVAKDLATVFTYAFQGRYDIDPQEIPRLGVKGTTKRIDRSGSPVDGNLYRDPIINKLLDLPFNQKTDKIYAALTNLKSAAVIFDLSRTEKDEAYSSIAHSTYIDPDLVHEWTSFVDGFTDYFFAVMQPSAVLESNPIWMNPSSDTTTCYINSRGELRSAKKGDYRTISGLNNLRQPDINRIARAYPDEFAHAVILGFPVIGAEFELPEPFSKSTPIGRVALAPKRAQKPRIVFIPLSYLDCMSRPLFHKLENLYSWNIQGVKSHDESRLFVQRLLANNPDLEEIWSFDQSSFTDNFDYYRIQRPILLALKRHNYINDYDLAVVDTINGGVWDATTLRRDYVRFGTGTGMGTPPSFVLASIGNGYLYAYAYYKVHGIYPDPRPDRPCQAIIVGDDSAIRGRAVAQEYLKLCEQIGLKVNTTKSMHSHHVAEFCGKMITKEGIYDKKKLIDMTSYAGVADNADYYQASMDEYLESFPEFRPLVRQLERIPRPFGLAEPLDLRNHIPIESMTHEQQVTLLQQQISSLNALQKEGKIPSLKEWKERRKRVDSLPRPSYELNVDTDEPKCDAIKDESQLTKSLIRDAIDIYQHADLHSVDELHHTADTIDRVYRLVCDLRGGTVEPTRATDHVSLTRRRDQDLADALTNIVKTVTDLQDSFDYEKGGDHYYE